MIDSLTFIVFLFIGHSQMYGECSGTNLGSTNPHVWFYSHTSHQIYHGKDADKNNIATPFLEEMSLRYPNDNFLGVKLDHLGSWERDYLPGNNGFDRVKSAVDTLKKKKVFFGGVVVMLGYLESSDTLEIENYIPRMRLIKYGICKETGNDNLPFMIAKFEMNGGINHPMTMPQNYKYKNRLENRIEALEIVDSYFKLFPVRYVPSDDYCDDHHYNVDGSRICAEDVAAIFQQNNFDFWNKEKP